MKFTLFSAQLGLLIGLLSYVAQAQTLPVLPSPDFDVTHNATVTGLVEDNAGNPVPSVLVKLMKNASPSAYPVSYAITGVDGTYSITGIQGVDYFLAYEFPAAGYTAGSANPGVSFTAAASQTADDFVLDRIPETITSCNVTDYRQTNWDTNNDGSPFQVTKPVPVNGGANLTAVNVFTAAFVSHPTITATASTAGSTVQVLQVGGLVRINGNDVSQGVTANRTFIDWMEDDVYALNPNEELRYYSVSSGASGNSGFSGAIPPAYTDASTSLTYRIRGDGSKTISTSGGNTTSAETTYAQGGVCVTYTYDMNPLPVKLAVFTAAVTPERNVSLEWSSTEEINSSGFEVQRSANAKNWVTVGTVAATGNSRTVQHYRFLDTPTGAHTTAYYRLKMIDLDGTFAYSTLESVSLPRVTTAFVSPNPARGDVIRITLKGTSWQEVSEVSVFDISGRKVLQPGAFDNGKLNVSTLTPGLYQVRLVYADGSQQSLPTVIN